ncbi:MAG: AAA family ATPase, partial [Candidatus Latescibacterota bacterium]
YGKASSYYDAAAALGGFLQEHDLRGRALSSLCIAHKDQGRLSKATEYIDEAIKLGLAHDVEEIGDWFQTQGLLAFWKGEFSSSLIGLKEALSRSKTRGRRRAIVNSHLALGRTYLALEDPKAARKHLEQGLEMALQLKFPREEALAYEFLGDLARAEGKGDEAGALYEKCMQIGLRIAPRGDVVVEVGRRLAEWHTERGEHNEARHRLEHALEIAESTGDRREEGILHRVRGRLIVASGGRQAAAEQSFKKSLAILEDVGARFEVALTHAARARVRAEAPRRTREERRRALDDFQTAAGILRELGLSRRQGLLLVEGARSLAGVLSPYEGLSLLREAEELLRPLRAEGVLGDIASLRAGFEEQTARVALEREGPFFLGEGDASSLEPAVRLLARRLGAKRAFLHLPHAPEGPRVVGCDAVEAEETLARLHFPGERTLLVSAGDLSGEGSACFGPFLAFRYGEAEASILYLERRIGAEPFREKEAGEFAASVERLLRKIPFAAREPSRGAYPTIIAGSRAMQDVVDRIVSVRNSSATVLIEGETGTGKGLLARLLHELGDRARTGRFIHLHCAELPETLLESELFGHVRGSFTGAVADKEGLFEIARGGTLFLDEVGDLTPAVQTRLLRVIEEGRMKRVGEAADREIDVRIIAATHRNLEKEIVRGRFRPDLFYRLQVVRIAVPPLRDRAGDIPLLADHFLTRYAREEGKEFVGIDSSALRLLARYPWPGNVRELQNEVRRILAVLPSGERIGERHLSPAIASGNALRMIAAESPLQSEIADFEEFRIREVLAESEGNAAAAARTLGLSPQLLRYKIRKYGISIAGQPE